MRTTPRDRRPLLDRAGMWVGGGLGLGLSLGVAVYLSTPPQQVATSSVELTEVAAVVDLGPAALRGRPVAVDTDAQILSADAIVRPVAEASGRSPATARASLAATARPLTRILDLTYTAPSAPAAIAGAQRAAEAFLEARQRLVLQPTRNFLEAVARAPVTTLPADGVEDSDYSEGISNAQATQEDRAISLGLELPQAGTVLEKARLTSVQDRGDVEVPLASGAALGALLGFSAWSYRRRRPAAAADQGRDAQEFEAGSGSAPSFSPTVPLSRRTTAGSGRRSRLVLGVCVVVLAIAGLALGSLLAGRVTAGATAEVTVLLTPQPGNAFSSRSGNPMVGLSTEAQVMRSDAVLERVAEAGAVDLELLRRRVAVRLLPDAEVVAVQVRAATGQRAEALATRVAEVALALRQERAEQTQMRRAQLIGSRIGKTEADAEAATRAKDLAASEILSKRLVTLRVELQSLTAPVASPGSLLATARVPSPSDSLLRLGMPVAGALLAAAIGWLLVRWLGTTTPPRWRLRPGSTNSVPAFPA